MKQMEGRLTEKVLKYVHLRDSLCKAKVKVRFYNTHNIQVSQNLYFNVDVDMILKTIIRLIF